MDVYIYGIGRMAKQIREEEINGDVVGYILTKVSRTVFRGKKVISPSEIDRNNEYRIIVANNFTEDIHSILCGEKIPDSQVIYMADNPMKYGITDDKSLSEFLGNHNWEIYCIYNNYDLNSTFFGLDKENYIKSNKRKEFSVADGYEYPILVDKYAEAGDMGLYFYQDLWAARLIYRSRVKEHFDIGSRIDGFIAHLLSMDIHVHLFDVREFPSQVDGLDTIVTDATYLHEVEDNSISSLSALCSLEHFGLGRYGDPIDPEACFKCFHTIQDKLAKGGHFYLSVPVGFERVEFNAHRIFYASTIIKEFGKLRLEEFSCAVDNHLETNIDIHKFDEDRVFGANNFGLFHFVKD